MQRGTLLALLLAALLVAAVSPLLGSFHYNFDEGLYILQARRILEGDLPYRDFFYHQTPLYPFTLALAGLPSPEGYVLYRAVSLVATALCGLVVYVFARRLVPEGPALLAMVLFYTVPLQYWGFLALPNALMMVTSTAGVALVWLSTRRRWVALGALLLVASILYKPLTLASGVALGLAVLVDPGQRGKVPVALAAGAAAGLGSWALFHVASGGLFTEVLLLQSDRFASGGGLEVMRAFPPFAALMAEKGIETPLDWNVHEHLMAFWRDRHLRANHWLALLAAAGTLLLWSPWGREWRSQRMLLTLWWAVPVAFSLFVWEPVWDHYFVQYLPALSLLGALVLARLWDAPGGARAPARIAVLATVAWMATLGPAFWTIRMRDFAPLTNGQYAGQTWLTFDPFLHVATGTEPACGVIDWINVYGRDSLTGRSPSRIWKPFHIDPEELIACVDADPEIRVALGFWSAFYCDARTRAYLETLPPERFVTLPGF